MLISMAILTTLFVAVVLWADATGREALRGVAKTAASAAFIAVGVNAGMLTSGLLGGLLTAALVLSVIGDIALIGKSKKAVAGGLGAFLLAHVAYSGAFLVRGVSGYEVVIALIVLLPATLSIWRWLMPHTGRLRPAVAAYIIVITALVTLSMASAGHIPGSTSKSLFAATVVFFVSDICVARQRFVAPSHWNRRIGLPLYYAAQLGLAHWMLLP
jgi:uncharacterized membrane protein YhhN